MYTTTEATMNATSPTATAGCTCGECGAPLPCVECSALNHVATQAHGVDLTGVSAAVAAFTADAGTDLAERVLRRLAAKGLDATWAEYVPSVHGADSRYGRRDAVLFVQGLQRTSCDEVIVRVTANYTGSSVTVGAFDAAGRWTQRGMKAEAARRALGM